MVLHRAKSAAKYYIRSYAPVSLGGDDKQEAMEQIADAGMPLDQIPPPTPLEVMRYRYHHGTNLGSCFVQERWLMPSMFPPGEPPEHSSELEAVKAWVKQIGMEATKKKFEKQWDHILSSLDLDWLVNTARCTSIRLPIGYFTLGPQFCEDTPFQPYAKIYKHAWLSVKNLVARCKNSGIGILLDFHALPGGANTGDHSGTNSGQAELWTSDHYLELATKCITFVAKEVAENQIDGVIGIQLVNEAIWNAPGMYSWYDSVLTEISQIDPSIPVIISDAWDLRKAIAYTKQKNTLTEIPMNPVIVDTHLYWAFTDVDKHKSPQEIIGEVWRRLEELDGEDKNVKDHGAVQVIVAEYSCAMTEDSWAKSNEHSKGDLLNQFGQAQSHRYQAKAGGSYFWTYKMDWMPGGEWGFSAQASASHITPPRYYTLPTQEVQSRVTSAQSQFQALTEVALAQHVSHWDRTAPGHYQHWRYEDGYKLGFNDAMAFFKMRANGGLGPFARISGGADVIGCLDLWVLKRLRDSKQNGPFLWEFEQGLRAGIEGFMDCVDDF